ncbi:ATP-binding protein [Pseudacidovorax intermedius]|uniref:ATP-binding protein n=1 Tax=Pseudacidovorax intermedius TaxID=433924 RepID=UPI0009EA6205|nr:ATP-binding protein [Pseudacidovorax intermedius]
MAGSIIGPRGSGKRWLACALAQQTCRRGQSALYLRVPRSAEELRSCTARRGSPHGWRVWSALKCWCSTTGQAATPQPQGRLAAPHGGQRPGPTTRVAPKRPSGPQNYIDYAQPTSIASGRSRSRNQWSGSPKYAASHR